MYDIIEFVVRLTSLSLSLYPISLPSSLPHSTLSLSLSSPLLHSVNWCGHWFEYFPNPPLNLLALIENTLSHHDPHLLQHFVSHKITAQIYAWPLLQTLFSEVLSKEEWLKLWDNILSQPLSFLLMVTTAYISSGRSVLLKCTNVEDIEVSNNHVTVM